MRKKLPRQFTKEQGCKFIQFTPNSENVKQAFERSQKLGVLSNSFTYGAGRMTGFLGEIAFELLYTKSKYVGGRILSHDYVLGRKKIDVKAKTCGGKPLPHYIASVNCSKTRPPKADYYYFVRVKKDLSCAGRLGWISQEKLIELGEYKRRGAEDESGFKYKVRGYHLPISDLKTPLSLR